VEFLAQNIEAGLVSVNRCFRDLCCSLVVYLRLRRQCMANCKLRCHRRWQCPYPRSYSDIKCNFQEPYKQCVAQDQPR